MRCWTLLGVLAAVCQAGKLKFHGKNHLKSTEEIKYETKHIANIIDHFTYTSNATYQMRYLVNSDFWKPNSKQPVFFYTGNEGSIEGFASNTGFMNEFAEKAGALIIYAEHRYYGTSLPFGKDSFTKENIKYLTVEQALADFATLIIDLRKNGGADGSPVIVFGGSYGGLLSAYMRMTYPQLVQGALAASAPVYWISGMKDSHGFWEKVTQDFNEFDNCEDNIRHGFSFLQDMAKDGKWTEITETMRTCQAIDENNFQHLLGWARNAMVLQAMLDYPYPTDFMAPLPGFPIHEACNRCGNAVDGGSCIREAAGLLYNGTDPSKYKDCFDIFDEYVYCSDPTGCGNGNDALSWDYQACTQQTLPGGTNGVTDMFPVLKFDPEDRAAYCDKTWGVVPDRDWLRIKYWTDDLSQTSNTIFSNGDIDPWGPGGVLADIRPDLPAPVVHGGAHHLDLRSTNKDDPQSVTDVRKFHEKTIMSWLDEFYSRN